MMGGRHYTAAQGDAMMCRVRAPQYGSDFPDVAPIYSVHSSCANKLDRYTCVNMGAVNTQEPTVYAVCGGFLVRNTRVVRLQEQFAVCKLLCTYGDSNVDVLHDEIHTVLLYNMQIKPYMYNKVSGGLATFIKSYMWMRDGDYDVIPGKENVRVPVENSVEVGDVVLVYIKDSTASYTMFVKVSSSMLTSGVMGGGGMHVEADKARRDMGESGEDSDDEIPDSGGGGVDSSAPIAPRECKYINFGVYLHKGMCMHFAVCPDALQVPEQQPMGVRVFDKYGNVAYTASDKNAKPTVDSVRDCVDIHHTPDIDITSVAFVLVDGVKVIDDVIPADATGIHATHNTRVRISYDDICGSTVCRIAGYRDSVKHNGVSRAYTTLVAYVNTEHMTTEHSSQIQQWLDSGMYNVADTASIFGLKQVKSRLQAVIKSAADSEPSVAASHDSVLVMYSNFDMKAGDDGDDLYHIVGLMHTISPVDMEKDGITELHNSNCSLYIHIEDDQTRYIQYVSYFMFYLRMFEISTPITFRSVDLDIMHIYVVGMKLFDAPGGALRAHSHPNHISGPVPDHTIQQIPIEKLEPEFLHTFASNASELLTKVQCDDLDFLHVHYLDLFQSNVDAELALDEQGVMQFVPNP